MVEKKVVIEDVPVEEKPRQTFDRTDTFRLPERFKYLNHIITRDLNNRYENPVFRKYTKQDILHFLKDPYRFEKQIRDACINVYGASSYFRRLIAYMTMLNDFSYVVSPNGQNVTKKNQRTVKLNFD